MQTTDNQNLYSLNSIAGYEDEKAEAIKIINLFKNFEDLKADGVSIPKGLILSGEPGVGKTLMAKVISAEANVPLYEYETTEGDSAKRAVTNLKRIYAQAKEHAPSIVFIDELDELVSSRDYVSDFSRLALKVLLTEIDGINNSDGVLTIATTNKYEYIPEALKRSGRMDKHIHFELPNGSSREAILKLYASNKNLIKDLNFRSIAIKTAGFSGADLKNLINETLIQCLSRNQKAITNKDFYDVIPTIAFKGIKKNAIKAPSDHVCYHELGHFICEYVLNNYVSEISTEQIGRVSGHVRAFKDFFEEDIQNESISSFEECKNEAIVALGGYAAEKYFLNQTYTGVASDFYKFGKSIEIMASAGMLGTQYIFTPKLKDKYIDPTFAMPEEDKNVDIKVKYFNEYLDIATDIIDKNKDLLIYLFSKLKENRKLDSEQVEEYINEFNK